MNRFTVILPKFIVRNNSKKAVRVLGVATISPGAVVDLFKIVNKLSESSIIDALREPDGELYREIWKLHNLELLDFALISLSEDRRLNSGIGQANKVLSTNNSGEIIWTERDRAAETREANLLAEPPLKKDGSSLYLPKADSSTNGYLSKEDWLEFRQLNSRVRIWQYQDFDDKSPEIMRLSKFQNGSIDFEEDRIVDNSAIVVSKNGDRIYTGNILDRALKKKHLKVDSHCGSVVTLSDRYSGACRIWFIVLVDKSIKLEGYSPPPASVTAYRSELMNLEGAGINGAYRIFGSRNFAADMFVDGKLGVNTTNPTAQLDVAGSAKVGSFFMSDGAAAGAVLVSNDIGQGTWQQAPSMSVDAPMRPYDGQTWISIPGREIFTYDAQTKIWIGTSTIQIDGAKQSSSTTNEYLNGIDRLPLSYAGLVLPFDCIMSFCSAAHTGDSNWLLEVRADGSPRSGASLVCTSEGRAYGENMSAIFKAGESVSLFAKGINVSMPRATAIFRRVR